MAYTPSSSFTLPGVYTPTAAFDFNLSVAGVLAVTTDNAVAQFVGSIPGVVGSLSVSTADATALFVGAVGLQGVLSFATDDATAAFTGTLQQASQPGYTPTTTFVFDGTAYTPTSDFDFNADSVEGLLSVTTDDAVGLFAGHVVLQGVLSVSTDDATAHFVASLVPQGSLSVSTDDALAQFTGHIVLQGTLSVSTDDATAVFVGKNITNVARFSVTTDDALAVFSGFYDPNVPRYTIGSTLSDQQQATQASLKVDFVYQQTVPAPLYTASIQQQASPLNHQVAVTIDQTTLSFTDTVAVVEQATPLFDSISSTSDTLTQTNIEFLADAEQAIPLADDWVAGFDILVFTHSETTHPVDDTGVVIHHKTKWVALEPPLEFRYTPGTSFAFVVNPAYNPNDAFVWPYTVPLLELSITHQRGVIRSETESHFQRALRLGVEFRSHVQDAGRIWTGGNASPWVPTTVYPPNPNPVDPPGHVTLTIPTQTAYIMQHTITVTLLDLTPISMESVNLSLDADSFAWQFSGTLLDKADLVKVQQVGTDAPVQLVITINGYSWKVLVERIEHSRQFGGRSISLSGRGLTALLGQPYEQPTSATQSSTLTVQQLAELLLPIGWTINWTAGVWNIPSGAYSYSNQTPIQALAALVGDIGAMIVPSTNAQVLNIMPRYPVLPWDFGLLSPDVVIPESAITELSQRPVVPYQANGVYVHGTEIGGILAWCRLEGTDGARLASTVSNALMTDAIGCRALGERIIAGQYTQPAVRSLSVPMDGVIVPLISVGQLVSVTLDGVGIKGIVNSVQIEATLGSVRQSIQIGEETPNTWAMFKELLPRDPLLVGTLSVTDSVTSLITLLDGGVVRVRGTGTVGGKYYIRAGKIDGEAPAMGQNEIVV